MTKWMVGLRPQFTNDGAGSGGGAAAATDDKGAAAGAAAAGAAADGKAGAATDDKGGKPAAPAAEGTSDDGKTPEAPASKTGGKDGAAAAASKAPEKYELAVSEDMAKKLGPSELAYVNTTMRADLEAIARASDWTNEDAQAELDAAVTRITARLDAEAAKDLAALTANEDFGGAKLEATQLLVNRAIDRVLPEGNPYRAGFKALIADKTVGNKLPVVAFLASVGKLMGEDRPTSGASATGTKDAAAVMYDHPSSKKAEEQTRA